MQGPIPRVDFRTASQSDFHLFAFAMVPNLRLHPSFSFPFYSLRSTRIEMEPEDAHMRIPPCLPRTAFKGFWRSFSKTGCWGDNNHSLSSAIVLLHVAIPEAAEGHYIESEGHTGIVCALDKETPDQESHPLNLHHLLQPVNIDMRISRRISSRAGTCLVLYTRNISRPTVT